LIRVSTAQLEPIMQNPFTALWTAKGSNLCLGHWEITYLGQSLQLAADKRGQDMGTHGIYSYIYPDDDDFAEGIPEDAWIAENAAWLNELFVNHAIPVDEAHLRWFYQAVNGHDWRCGSCGGCI
jgi:hypothetical protein